VARRDVYAASIVDYLSRHEGWSKAVEIARGADVPKGSMYGLMATLVKSGSVEGRPSDQGGGYKLRAHSDEGEESAKTAPASPPAPAPASPPPEHPANVAPAPELLRPQAGLAPFAGIDAELVVIGEVVRRIESLTGHETRVRVAAYVASRFLP
jgi:hypothetical protein